MTLDQAPLSSAPPDEVEADDAGAESSDSGGNDRYQPYLERFDRGLDWLAGNWPHLVVTAGVFAYFLYYRQLTVEIHDGYGTSAFDIGVFDQGTWLLSQFKNPFVTITGRNLFGDHTSFILLLVAPLYWVFPGASTLLTLQAATMALGAVPVYLIGVSRLGKPLACVLAIVYLTHPALGASNMENFHPDGFLALLVGMALYGAIEDKRKIFLVSVVLCMMVKEDMIIIILPLALWYAWKRHLRLGLVVAALSGLWTLLAFRIIRSFNHGMDLQTGLRVPFGTADNPPTLRGVVETAYRQPGVFWDYLRSEERPWYLWQMLIPTGFMFIFEPSVILIAAPVLFWNILSTFGYQHLIGYHYVMQIVPILTIGTIWGIARLKKVNQRRAAVALVAVLSVWTMYLWGPTSWGRNGEPGHWLPSNPAVAQFEEIRKQVPDDAVVSAFHSFVPHMDHRDRIYLWPVPWRAVYWGQVDKEGQKLDFTNDIEYLFIPTTLAPEDQALFDTFKDEFEVVAQNPGATLYKRVRPGA
ncbi:MAG TPA: DUF2079 domain-containing protein [Acidimicrobiia bacterium]|nr:DUF2079 domain-containing protein [Acidimicrobiia bacterium]